MEFEPLVIWNRVPLGPDTRTDAAPLFCPEDEIEPETENVEVELDVVFHGESDAADH